MFFFCGGSSNPPMVNCWFAARWFGFLGFPYERDCYLGVPDSNPKSPGPKPTIKHLGGKFK